VRVLRRSGRLPIGPLLAAALALAWPSASAAQALASERIVAVVGQDVILLSELEEQTVIAATQAGIDPGDAAVMAELRREVLEQMVADLVVVAAAGADTSITVSESSVSEALEAELSEIRTRFPTPADFEREIERSQWRTMENYRKSLRRIKRRELLAQAFLSKHGSRIQAPPIGEEEVRAYFEENAARFGTKPATVRIRELDLLVQPTEPALAEARALADSLLAEIRQGASFAELARAFSEDPASAERGGDLGYFRRGAMVPAFEEAAFGIDSVGGLAGPVESAFGIHVIRLDDRQGEEIKARHILIVPEISEADRSVARALGEALVDSLAAGADFDSLRARYSSSPRPGDEPVEGPASQLPAEWQTALRDLPVGGTSGLLSTPAGVAILKLEGRGGGEPYTFEELEPRLRAQLARDRGQQTFVESLRQKVYVDVRMPQVAVGGAPSAGGAVPAPAAPQVEAPAAGAAAEAYVPPDPGDEPPAPARPLENPPPVADTPPPREVPNPETLPPVGDEGPPGRVDPAGAVVDSTGRAEPPKP
jgi:peptidyl-prolyl cis-trans isomerase SurA